MTTIPKLPDLRPVRRLPAIVGLGDPVRADEAVGLHIMGELREFARSWLGRVEFVDPTLPGHDPSSALSHRPGLVIVGTLARGDPPGTVHVLSGRELTRQRSRHPNAAPSGNTTALLTLLRVFEPLPERVTVVGIEPERIERAMGLSEPVRAALPLAVRKAHDAVEAMIAAVESERLPETGLGDRAAAG